MCEHSFCHLSKLTGNRTSKTVSGNIDRIEVYETEGVGKNRTQRVVIFWKFVGYIELPECVPQKNYKADTRQGVAVEYHTQALPA